MKLDLRLETGGTNTSPLDKSMARSQRQSQKAASNEGMVVVSGQKEGRSSTRSEAKSSEYLPLEVGLLRRYNSWNKYVSIDGLGDKDPETFAQR
jgi:hypothetical protein